jgi:O-antigen/teichoic acid export membrane protein
LQPTNTSIIAKNTLWSGVENSFAFFSSFITSIAIARVIGPERLAYFNYVMWLTNMTGLIGSLGIPVTTRKYMAEYLGANQPGLARAVFSATFRLQCGMATVLTGMAMAVVVLWGDPAHRTVSLIQIAGMLPAMLVYVPSQANNAREDMRANVASSILGGSVFFIGAVASLIFGWDLIGIAISFFLMRLSELVARIIPVMRWVRALPRAPLPPELWRKMRSFSGQGLVLMLLNLIVWDRSDVIFLKLMSSEIAQISFYTVAFNLTERALIFPQTLGQAIGASLMAQYGRDRSRLAAMTATGALYMYLFALPMLLGLACLSPAVMSVLYGVQYLPAIPVLAIAAAMAAPKPLLLPAQQLLQTEEKQGFLIGWSCFCAAINCALDILLIPSLGASGAAIANGSAQALAVGGIWTYAVRHSGVRLDFRRLGEISLSAAVMVSVAYPLGRALPPWPALLIAPPLAAAVFLAMLRWRRVLDETDRARFAGLGRLVPGPGRPTYHRLLSFLCPAAS